MAHLLNQDRDTLSSSMVTTTPAAPLTKAQNSTLDTLSYQLLQAGKFLESKGAPPVQVPGIPSSINSDSIKPQTPIPYNSPVPTPAFNVSSIDTTTPTPAITATPKEMEADALSKKIQSLNDSFANKSVDQTAADTAAGIPDLQTTYDDLSTQLKGLQKEALAIPLQLQNDAIGRGVTTQALAGETAASQRENAVKALNVSVLLDSAQGKLTNAQAKADKAVAQKYDPIQAQITAAKSNLDLILNSAEYSVQDKNRAQAQLDIQNAKQRELDKQKTNYSTIQAMAAAAVKNAAGNPAATQAAQAALNLDPNSGNYLVQAFSMLAPYQTDATEVASKLADLHIKQAEAANASALSAADLAYKQAQVKKAYADIASAATPASKTGDGTLAAAFNNALLGLPANAQKQAMATFNSYVQAGNTAAAKDYIVRIAVTGLPAAEQSQAIGRSQALSALTDIQGLLDQAKAKNVNTNILTGNIVNIAQKLGTTNNPDLTYIGSRIQQQLQTYRRAMTGVAFSPQESAEYAKIFPSVTNTDTLNTSKISALVDGLDSNNRAQIAFAIGDANYDAIFGKPAASSLPSSKPSAPAGTTVYLINGAPWAIPNQNVAAFLKDYPNAKKQ